MKTLVIAQQKGGVGKTASVVHLAFDFLERGLKVAVIDVDTQGNASYTLKEFDSGYHASRFFNESGESVRNHFGALPSDPVLRLIGSDLTLADIEQQSLSDAGNYFHDNIIALKDCGFDVVLVDTAPSLGNGLIASLYSADYVLSPIELEAYSLMGISKLLDTITNVNEVNTSLKFLGILPSKVDSRNPRHLQHLAELQEAYPDMMIPANIGLRSSIADALATQIPVWTIKKTAARKAAKEVRAMAAYVYDKMEIA